MSSAPADIEVVITGLGVVSPLGHNAAELATRVASGEGAVRELDTIAGAAGAPIGAVPLDHLPQETRTRVGRLDRLCHLLLSSAFQAVGDAGLDIALQPERVGLSFGTGLGCLLTNAEYFDKVIAGGASAASPRLFAYTVSNAAAGEVSIALGIKGANSTSHAGLAAGLQAIGYAADLIRLGKADVVLAGGADALGTPLLQGLNELGVLRRPSLPFSGNQAGFCPSEGAAVVVLERADLVRSSGRRALARIAGYAAGFEPTLTGPAPDPAGVVATLQRALQLSGIGEDKIGAVFTSASGGRLDDLERQALETVFRGDPVLFAPKAALGESFGASGALAAALATKWLSSSPSFAPTSALVWNVAGNALPVAAVAAAWRATNLVMVHSLCYAGPTVALVLAREELS